MYFRPQCCRNPTKNLVANSKVRPQSLNSLSQKLITLLYCFCSAAQEQPASTDRFNGYSKMTQLGSYGSNAHVFTQQRVRRHKPQYNKPVKALVMLMHNGKYCTRGVSLRPIFPVVHSHWCFNQYNNAHILPQLNGGIQSRMLIIPILELNRCMKMIMRFLQLFRNRLPLLF